MISKYSLGEKTPKRRQAGSCSSQGVGGLGFALLVQRIAVSWGAEPFLIRPGVAGRGGPVPSGELREVPERGFSSAYRVSPTLIWEAGGEREGRKERRRMGWRGGWPPP